MTPFKSFSPGGVPIRDPDEVRIMRKSVDEHPDSDRMIEETADFGIIWSGNGYSRRNTWILSEKDYVIDLERAR